VAPNLTPDRETGLGNWTDGEKIRAASARYRKDGPCPTSHQCRTQLLLYERRGRPVLVAYLNVCPRSVIRCRGLSCRQTREEIEASRALCAKPVPPANSRQSGVLRRILGNHSAYCEECHTPQKKGGSPDILRRYAGGQVFRTPMAAVVEC